jgi:ribosomal-protein-alanine N-acetyltransferase
MSAADFSLFSAKDAEAVAALDKARFPLSPYKKATFLNSLRINSQQIILAEEKGKIVGFLFFGWVLDEAEIYRLAVTSEKEGQGIGTELLNQGLAFLTSHAVSAVFLEVRKSNLRAQKVYLKAGFETYRIRQGYYDNGEDALCMKKGLYQTKL